MKNLIIALVLVTLVTTAGISQTTGDYRSINNVNFTTPDGWQVYNGSQWVAAATAPTVNSGTVTVTNYCMLDNNLNIGGTLNINGVTVSTTINSTINLTGNLNVNSGTYFGFTGVINIQSTGILTNNARFDQTSGTMNIAGNFVISPTGASYCTGAFTIQNTGVITNNGRFDMSGGTLTIYGNYNISSNAVSENTGSIIIKSTGSLINNNVFQSFTYLEINGLLNNSGTNFYQSSKVVFNNGGQLIYNQDGGSIPAATWNTGSTLKITGITNSYPNSLNQAFYNLIWDCQSQNNDFHFYDNLTTVNGDLSFLNTNGKIITLFGYNDNALNVGGNVTIGGNTKINLSNGNIYNKVKININGNYTQTGGTFELGSSINGMNLKGNFVSSGGKVTRMLGSAKINFYGTGIQYYTSTNASETSNGVNIEVAKGSTLVLLTNMSILGNNVNTDLYLYGTLDMNNHNISMNYYFNVSKTGVLKTGTGILSTPDASTNAFQLDAGGTIYIGSNAGISTTGTTGNIQVKGTRTYDAAANYVFNGTSQQSQGNGVPSTISGNLTIDNSVNFGTSITVSGTINMNSGLLDMGTNTLYLANSSVSSLNYTSGFISGKFQRDIAKTTGQYIFPVGISSFISRKVIIDVSTPSSTTGSITAEFIPSDPGGATGTLNDGSYLLDTYSKTGYWRISQSSLTGFVYTLSLDAQMFPGIQDYTKLHIIKRTNASSNWSLQGTHLPGSGDNTSPTAYRSILSSFSEFAIAGKSSDNPLDGPLPVTLQSFSASVNLNSIKLSWSTINEENNSGFEIERAVAGNQNTEFIKIGFVKGNGTTNQISNYSFSDIKLQSGKYKYRLKQVDFNGNFEYHNLSNDINISTPAKYNLEQNYPNPFNPSTKISYEIAQDSKVSLKIYDMTGKEVVTLVNDFKAAGYYSVDFNASNLASGIYLYKIEAGSYSKVLKMALVK